MLLSHFSHVWLCVTPETESPSLGFSRWEHWSGLPFPSPMHESEKWKGKSEMHESEKWKGKLCPTLHDPMDCSLPGSSIHGICQARVLEWGAIAFSTNSSNNCLSLLSQSLKLFSYNLLFLIQNLPAVQETGAQSLGREDPLEKEMEPIAVFLPEESHGHRSLVGCSPWDGKESGTMSD